MGAIIRAASDDGCSLIIDGTNASDPADDRPGMKALKEFGIRSPLRECGITKQEVRRRSKEAGLPVWNKPAYACLATRIPCGEIITEEKLSKTEKAENTMREMGFTDFRVRMRGDSALVQIREDQHARALDMSERIETAIGGLYDSVQIDEKPRPLR